MKIKMGQQITTKKLHMMQKTSEGADMKKQSNHKSSLRGLQVGLLLLCGRVGGLSHICTQQPIASSSIHGNNLVCSASLSSRLDSFNPRFNKTILKTNTVLSEQMLERCRVDLLLFGEAGLQPGRLNRNRLRELMHQILQLL